MMKNNWIESIVGAVVFFGAAFLLSYAYFRTSHSKDNRYVISADFERVDGLSKGNDVRMAGIKVGEVVDCVLDAQSYMARVYFSLDPSIRVPEDSSVAVQSESLLGGKYLNIAPGGEESYVKHNGSLSNTQSSVNIESLISKMVFSSSK